MVTLFVAIFKIKNKKQTYQSFLIFRGKVKYVIFGNDNEKTMRRQLKYKFKLCHVVKTSSRDAHATLSHIHHRAISVDLMFKIFWTVEGNCSICWDTCKLQIDRAKLLRGSCAAPAPPCCPTFKCSLIFFCFGTMWSTLYCYHTNFHHTKLLACHV